MVKDKGLISSIRDKKLSLSDLGFEITRRCNLRCEHCYKGDAQPVDMDPEIPRVVFDYFKDIDQINLLGGESQLNPKGLLHICNALKENKKTKFKSFGFVTNGTIVNEEFLDILEEINSLSSKDGVGVNFGISNDYWHNKSMQKVGITQAEVEENFKRMRNKHPNFFINYRSYVDKSEMLLMPVGRAANLKQPEIRFGHCYESKIEFFEKRRKHNLLSFTTDAKGNSTQRGVSYKKGDKINYGNVLKKSIDDILIKHGSGCNKE